MTGNEYVLCWINSEIPRYLNKFSSYADFDKAMPSACASTHWKVLAYAMAKERWAVPEIVGIPG